jgi:hypothetical protein
MHRQRVLDFQESPAGYLPPFEYKYAQHMLYATTAGTPVGYELYQQQHTSPPLNGYPPCTSTVVPNGDPLQQPPLVTSIAPINQGVLEVYSNSIPSFSQLRTPTYARVSGRCSMSLQQQCPAQLPSSSPTRSNPARSFP